MNTRRRGRGAWIAVAATVAAIVAAVTGGALVGGPAPPVQIGWADLRAAGGPECVAWHQLSQSPKICAGVPTDMGYHRCAAATVSFNTEVEITGYAHPVAMDFDGVRRFLLMPALAPCRHAPPPMGNQIILVDYPPGIDMSVDPVRLTGHLVTELSLHGLIQVRYRMTATSAVRASHSEVRD